MHGNTSFDVSTTEIGPYLLVDIGIEGERQKKVEKHRKAYISHHHPNALPRPIVTKLGKVGGMAEVVNRAKLGVNRIIGVSSAGS